MNLFYKEARLIRWYFKLIFLSMYLSLRVLGFVSADRFTSHSNMLGHLTYKINISSKSFRRVFCINKIIPYNEFRHDIPEILLKVTLKTITPIDPPYNQEA